MAKSIINQRYIYKNKFSRFTDADYDLNLDVDMAKKNNELVSMNDSIALRILRDITNKTVSEKEINKLKKEIKKLKQKKKTKTNTEKISNLYKQLEEKTVVTELNSIVFDSMSEWTKANSRKGIKLNGSKRIRTIGTNGGVKKNTVLFTDESIFDEFDKRLENGRDKTIKYVPAKFESYKALAFSGSTPVTQPKGVLVIDDGVHEIEHDVLLLSDDGNGRFDLNKKEKYKTSKQFTDGCCMISKELSDQWAIDLGEYDIYKNGIKQPRYTPTGFIIRNAYCKGTVFTFPYNEFAEDIAHSYIVKDVWGNDIDIRNVDLIITTNMLKLWKAYSSIDDYMNKCKENGFEFCVAKILPQELEKTRNMNYQFLQSYELSDEDIKKLIKPTINSIKGALSEDYLKMILFLKGSNLTEADFTHEESNYLKALMIDKRMKNDPFIQQKVYKMIEKKINDAKKGVIEVDGSYEVVSGDLYALCQYMFGMEVTGILQYNEFYSYNWLSKGVNKIVSYRAPMTLHNNIKVMPLIENKETKKWYRYMRTCLIVNIWDYTAETMCGEDFDGDANITTNNEILINNTKNLLPVICEQKSTEKQTITKTLLKKANKNGFNNNVGRITNRCTNMYDVLSKFQKGSEEYNEMMYRITCMQGYQQEIIDSIKGIIPKEVPQEWYNYKAVKIQKDEEENVINEKLHNQKLLANKKPYFFIYNYPKLMKKYKKYIESNNTNCLIKFGVTLDELLKSDLKNDNGEKEEFIKYYYLMMPVSIEKSLMNRLCWCVEEETKDIQLNINNNIFDYNFLKTNSSYSKSDKKEIGKIFKQYKKEVQNYLKTSNDEDDMEDNSVECIINKYQSEVFKICNDEDMVCDILIDICYSSNQSKQFMWDICGDVIVKRLLEINNNIINIPIVTQEITNTYWQGEYYKLKEIEYKEEKEC